MDDMYARAFWLGPVMMEGMKQMPKSFFIIFYSIIAAVITVLIVVSSKNKKNKIYESKPE